MSTGYRGARDLAAESNEFNALSFLITQIVNRVSTATIVQVQKVTNSGGLAPVGFVDVLPLVAQVDSNGQPMPHGVVHNVPYTRIQGGTDAIILDPKPGDLGIALFADRDISSVKANKSAALPGSRRRYDMADAMYIGGLLNGAPQQYVQFTASGINVVSPSKITCQAPTVEVDAQNANVNASTSAAVTAPAITLGASGQSLLSFVTSAFMSLFNSHTHASSGAGVPNQQMGATHMTSTVKGG